jgi:hypothetical protein
MPDDTPTFIIGQRVLVRSAMYGVRSAIVRGFQFDDDEDAPLVVVDFDPPLNGARGNSFGFPIRRHQIIGHDLAKRD